MPDAAFISQADGGVGRGGQVEEWTGLHEGGDTHRCAKCGCGLGRVHLVAAVVARCCAPPRHHRIRQVPSCGRAGVRPVDEMAAFLDHVAALSRTVAGYVLNDAVVADGRVRERINQGRPARSGDEAVF